MTLKKAWLICFILFSLLLFAACDQIQNDTDDTINVVINVDGDSISQQISPGDTVQDVLDSANISLSTEDIVDPPTYTVITEGKTIEVIRVTEEFLSREETVPFSSQTVKNETLPEGQTLLIQKGENGTLEITTKVIYHNNIEQSRTEFARAMIEAPKPEIVMVGIQSPFSPVAIQGKIAYITTGNIWVMENNTGNRRPVVTSGDADGQVLKISPDGEWLLFTKTIDEEEEEDSMDINALYAVSLIDPDAQPFSLNARNVIHFADWDPNRTRTITYSTVEPRETSDWLANNDLYLLTFNTNGTVLTNDSILDSTKDGVNFWWGTDFAWSPDGARLAYAKPDSVGLVDIEDQELIELYSFPSYEPDLDWRWLPSLGWSFDHAVLYTIKHQTNQNGSGSLFSLTAVLPSDAMTIDIVPDVGMFSFPVPSPIDADGRYQIAYLQAIFPERSDTSRYNLMAMDRDGSNRTLIFPPEGSLGLTPQEIQWEPLGETAQSRFLAFIYQGNIYVYDFDQDETIQITGDGSITTLHWK